MKLSTYAAIIQWCAEILAVITAGREKSMDLCKKKGAFT